MNPKFFEDKTDADGNVVGYFTDHLEPLFGKYEQKFNYVESRLLTLGRYYNTRFVKDESTAERLIEQVLFREQEFIHTTNRLSDAIDKYSDCKISDLYGYTLTEFLKLPPIEITLLCDKALKRLSADDSIKDKVKKKMDKELM